MNTQSNEIPSQDATMEAIERLVSKVVKMESAQAALQKKIEGFTPEGLKEVTADISKLHSQLKLMILRVTVATELCYLQRVREKPTEDFAQAVVEAFDKPDKWWKQREEDTLDEWVDHISKIRVAA